MKLNIAVALIVFITSCSHDVFHRECVELIDIMDKSNSLLKVKNSKNIYNTSGEIVSTTVELNKQLSLDHIEINKENINRVRASLMSHINAGDEYRDDAVYVLVFSTAYFNSILGITEENSCKYQNLIKTNQISPPSDWVLKNLFFRLLSTKDALQQNGDKMDEAQMLQRAYDFMLNSQCNEL